MPAFLAFAGHHSARALELTLSAAHQLVVESNRQGDMQGLSGLLLDPWGRPLKGEWITLEGRLGTQASTFTDSDGRFQIPLHSGLTEGAELLVLGHRHPISAEMLAQPALSFHSEVKTQGEHVSVRICARPLRERAGPPIVLVLQQGDRARQEATLDTSACLEHPLSPQTSLTFEAIAPYRGETTLTPTPVSLSLDLQLHESQHHQHTLHLHTQGPASLRGMKLLALLQGLSASGELLSETPFYLEVGETTPLQWSLETNPSGVDTLQVRLEGLTTEELSIHLGLSQPLVLPAPPTAPLHKGWWLLACLPLLALAWWLEHRRKLRPAPSPSLVSSPGTESMPASPAPAKVWLESFDSETREPVASTLFGQPGRLLQSHHLSEPFAPSYTLLAPGYLPTRFALQPDMSGAQRIFLRPERLELRERYLEALKLLEIPFRWGQDTPTEIASRYPQAPHLQHHLDTLALLTERAYFGPNLPSDALSQSEHHLRQLREALL